MSSRVAGKCSAVELLRLKHSGAHDCYARPSHMCGSSVFEPAIGVSRYTDLEDAVARANSTPAGLAAYVYTEDLSQTFYLGRRLDYGNVAVNNVDAGIMNAPYGGRKGSGYGYEHGREGLEGYLQLKHFRVRHGA